MLENGLRQALAQFNSKNVNIGQDIKFSCLVDGIVWCNLVVGDF